MPKKKPKPSIAGRLAAALEKSHAKRAKKGKTSKKRIKRK